MNTITKSISFGDSLNRDTEYDLVNIVRFLLKSMAKLIPKVPDLSSRSWARPTLSRRCFGIPQNTKFSVLPVSNSCGVALVLAAKDFASLSPKEIKEERLPNFNWSLIDNAKYHLQIL